MLPAFVIDSWLTGRRLVSLPFSDFCEPLFSSSSDIEQIKKEIFRHSENKKLSYVEFRSSETKFPFDTQQYRTDLRHILYLNKSEDELLRSFSENNRRNIKKAAKQNVNVDISNSPEGLSSFYEMFCITRKKHGLPPQPFSFFRNIFELIIRPGYGDIILAKHNDNYVAGSMYFKFGEKILYKFGASYPQHNDLRANNAVMWFAIRKYLNENYKEFDFGRTETFHEGLRKFKLGWNTEERIIYTTRFYIKKSSYQNVHTKTEGTHNKILRHIPVWALKLMGEILYKHVG